MPLELFKFFPLVSNMALNIKNIKYFLPGIEVWNFNIMITLLHTVLLEFVLPIIVGCIQIKANESLYTGIWAQRNYILMFTFNKQTYTTITYIQ